MSRPNPASFFAMDQQFVLRDLVIKVKYGDSLRRISASVHGNLMDHNMSKLRAKIIDLFKFSNDSDLILSYTDEDGDIVTLDNDDELRDAVIGQCLNPLRLNVQLKSTGASDATSERSSQAKSPQPDTLPTVDEPLKSIPEPFINVLSNLFNIAQNVVSSPAFEGVKSEPLKSAMENLSKDVKKAASFSPALAQVVDKFSKLGSSNPSRTSDPTGNSSGGPSGASTHLMDLNVVHEPKASTEPIVETTELPGNITGSVDPVPKQSGGDTSSSADLNTDVPRNATESLYPLEDLMDSIWAANKCSGKDKNVGSSKLNGKSISAMSATFPRANQNTHNSDNFWGPVQPFPTYLDNPSSTMSGDGSINHYQFEACSSFPAQTCFNAHSDVPISRQDELPDFLHAQPMHPYLRSHIDNENTLRTYHKGVQCDGCGMHPIVGPRFKSNVKENYDFCNICFTQMGNENDYTKIERSSHRAPRLIKQLHNRHSRPLIPQPNALLRRCGVRPPRAKLESHFIQDVTVLDGTVMPPLTHFTKIWRLRNNGTVAWPFGTQLVWVGGDQFGDRVSVDLEIPGSGFPVDKELDIAVDFTAPSRVGRYASYWRMSSPSGQKFGQQVWIIIQVECFRPNSSSGSFYPDLNLNLPPESSNRNGSVIIDVNAEPLDTGFSETNITVTTEELVKPVAVDAPKQLVEQQPAKVDGDLLDANDKVLKSISDVNVEPPDTGFPETNITVTTEELVTPVAVDVPKQLVEQQRAKEAGDLLDANDEVLKSTSVAPAVFPLASDSLIDLSATPSTVDPSTVEETLLKELEEMGFKQIDLNKEILRHNEYNLEQSVEDLCGFSEWGPLLSELKSTSVAPVVSHSASDSLIDLYATPSVVDPSTVEETLLKELEEMGFKQIDLNKEILRHNEYDLEQSVKDLCGSFEWDFLLSELSEMGFTNKELNKKLLMKNGGSIKRVVLDLIAGKKEMANKYKVL